MGRFVLAVSPAPEREVVERAMTLPPLDARYPETREALRSLACYVISPARKRVTGRIGLRPFGAGFATPPFDDGSRIAVAGDQLARVPGAAVPITTLRAGADFLDLSLTADPGVGSDLPTYEPDANLPVDAGASLALGDWYRFGQEAFDHLAGVSSATVTEAQIWPEHFDLAVTAQLATGESVNVGFSPGDGFHADPYLYVGPHAFEGFTDAFWNAPFGAYLPYEELRHSEEAALAFIGTGLMLAARP